VRKASFHIVTQVAGILVGIVSLPCLAASTSEARAAMAQFQAEGQLALDAQTQHDAKAMVEHQAKAQEYLLQARRLYEQAGAASSKDVRVLRDYADVLLRVGDSDLAAEALQRVVKQATDDAAIWRELGRALSPLGHRRAGESIRALRRSLDLDSHTADAANTYAILGRVYRQEGLFDLAEESFAKGLAVDPSHIPCRLGLIAAKIRNAQVREASDDLDALGLIPQDYGDELAALLADAVQRFEQSRRWFADTAENHMAYAKILFRVGRMRESLNAAERAAQLAPDTYTTWNFIGDLSRQLDSPARSREAYRRSLELKPDQPRTVEALHALDQTGPTEPKNHP
jgi:tetratricopeptide (TPR) repeat protein